MVERRLLTREFVDSVEIPSHGERWIADTVVRGFGLRLWNNRRGGGVAFALRTSDKNGHSIRKTFQPYFSAQYYWGVRTYLNDQDISLSSGIRLGIFLDDARSWAATEIARAKGRLPTLEEAAEIEAEYLATRRRFQSQFVKMSLGRAAEIIISYGPYRGWSQRYMDRMISIFFSNIPLEMQNTQIAQITEAQITSALSSDRLKPSNLWTLRTLLHQIFARLQEMGGPPLLQYLPYYGRKQIQEKQSDIELFTSKLDQRDFQQLFQHLEIKSEKWPHLLCLRVFFELDAPLSRLMAARWHQILEDRWYPFRPGDRKYWEYRWCRINSTSCSILEKAFALARDEFGGSPFWFPSQVAVGQHIKNADRVWYSVLQATGWPSGPLRLFAQQYRRLTLFDDLLRGAPNIRQRRTIMAKLSKIRAKIPLTH